MKSAVDKRIIKYISEYGNNVLTDKVYNGITVNEIADNKSDFSKTKIKMIKTDGSNTLLNIVDTDKYILTDGTIAEYENHLYSESILLVIDYNGEKAENYFRLEKEKLLITKKCGASSALQKGIKCKQLEIAERLFNSAER